MFPHRIRGYYVEGSYANGSNVASSDIDLVLIFKGKLEQDEQKHAEDVAKEYALQVPLELDIEMGDEHSLMKGMWPSLKMGSHLLYGEDIRNSFPLVSLREWTRDRMHSSYWRTVKLFHRPAIVRYPLDYPDPSGEFYGYDLRKLRLPSGEEVNCTRDLIRLTGWSATALLAYKAGQYVVRKSDCHKMYKEYFDDEWSELLQDIYDLCRGRWNYLIPQDQKDRLLLRAICERTLGFENHFLLLYKEFLLSELRSADTAGRQQALWVLKQIPYQDNEIQQTF